MLQDLDFKHFGMYFMTIRPTLKVEDNTIPHTFEFLFYFNFNILGLANPQNKIAGLMQSAPFAT